MEISAKRDGGQVSPLPRLILLINCSENAADFRPGPEDIEDTCTSLGDGAVMDDAVLCPFMWRPI